MDTIWAPVYDREWGAVSPSHQAFVGRLLELTRRRGTLLDAACGTGKYWPLVLASGRTVVGADQSRGMLAAASAKHPDVPVGRIGLQELAFDALFDAVMCVDALKNIGPEDWPVVIANLRHAARPGGHLYVTSEMLDEQEVRAVYESARAAGAPVVPGELFDGVGYHFYPEAAEIHAWFHAAGLERLDEQEGDEYRHFLLRRPINS